ncbi:MAG: hypothetical protein M3O90_04360, partial [Actinomycetota bacterium]|nr:hypothetical protein [Actinomycetota bacterium]
MAQAPNVEASYSYRGEDGGSERVAIGDITSSNRRLNANPAILRLEAGLSGRLVGPRARCYGGVLVAAVAAEFQVGEPLGA